jgi:hypothetical protein
MRPNAAANTILDNVARGRYCKTGAKVKKLIKTMTLAIMFATTVFPPTLRRIRDRGSEANVGYVFMNELRRLMKPRVKSLLKKR